VAALASGRSSFDRMELIGQAGWGENLVRKS